MDEFYREVGKLDTEAAPLSEIEQARITEKVTAQCAPKKKRHRIVALIVAAAIALTACTAAVVNYTDWFTFIASPGSEEVTQQLFSDMGMVIGKTVKDEETGVSITLDGCLYDGERMALALTVKGVELEEQNKLFASGNAEGAWLISETAMERARAYYQEYFGEAWTEETEEALLEMRKTFFGSLGQIYLVSMDENDRTLRLEITTGSHALGSTEAGDSMQLYLKNISYRGECLIPGEFLFTFTLPERDLIKYYTYTGAPLRTETGEEIPISKIVLSPSGVGVYFDMTGMDEGTSYLSGVQLVRLQDGITYGFSASERNQRVGEGDCIFDKSYYANWQFISPNEVEAICLGEGIWIELSDLEEYTPEETEE